MRPIYVCVSVCLLLICARAEPPKPVLNSLTFEYPEVRRDETVIDDYHGIQIKDPYRWLEDPDSEETKAFIEAQNNLTLPFLEECPMRSELNTRMKDMWNFPRYFCPFREGDRYYYFMNSGLQSHKVLYVQDSLDGEPRVFLDPNTLSEDGTVSLSTYSFSDDGTKFAYGLSASGSDWSSVYIRDVDTDELYPESLEKVKFSDLSWTSDNKGFFYSAYLQQTGKTDGSETVSNRNQKLYYHRLNTSQSEDVVVAEFPEEPFWKISGLVTYGGRYLLVSVVKDYRDSLEFFADLGQLEDITGLLPLTQIVHKFEAEYNYVTTEGSVCIFLTNKDAPNYRIIKIDLNDPAEENRDTLVPEHPKDVLQSALAVTDNYLILHYIRDVKSVIQLHDLKSGELLQTLESGIGSLVDIEGKRTHSEFFFYIWTFLSPGMIYYINFNNTSPFKPTVFRENNVKDFDASQYEAKQVFYPSKDGTQIPMFIISKKDLVRDGSHPALLYGYGGFNINIRPTFDILRLVFIQLLGGVVALPNLRGGGEYGERWYNAGKLLNKQNVFDDFQAAAEYLVAENYTSSDLLTIQGGSNGGLLVAACINQRPELYGAAIAQTGVMDLLRYHMFTIGHSWVSDYGISENKTQFEYLIKYSPLHNVQPPSEERAQYPATLVLTADHDDRVVPLHSLKFIATLQHAVRGSSQMRPLLARIDTKAGHGGGKPTAKIIEEYTDILCFITEALNLN